MGGLFDDLDKLTNEINISKDKRIIRAPFGWAGSKHKIVNQIIPHLPYRKIYVEPFGGSGVVLLNRYESDLEIFNDRYAGITCFYRCIRNKEKMEKLIERLDLTIHSREEFIWCKETWENVNDDVERAARWFYMISYSFSTLGRNWARCRFAELGNIAGKIKNRLKEFPIIHKRFEYVQIENVDWRECLKDYDSSKTVFYIDPPYIETPPGTYKHTMLKNDHRELLDIIFNLKGFVGLSGYANPLYDNQNWDKRLIFKTKTSIEGMSFSEKDHKEHMKGLINRSHEIEEILWIKE